MAKRLFVGGLPYEVTSDELRDMFSAHGEVVSCDVITDRFSGRSKGFAFVEMKDDAEADNAIKALNDTLMGTRKIIVNVARPREERSPRDFGGGGGGGYGQRNDRFSRGRSGGGGGRRGGRY